MCRGFIRKRNITHLARPKNKNLTFSSTFYLSFFRKGPGQDVPLSASQPFNITRKETNDDEDSSAPTSSIITSSIKAPTPSTISTFQRPHRHPALRPPHQHPGV